MSLKDKDSDDSGWWVSEWRGPRRLSGGLVRIRFVLFCFFNLGICNKLVPFVKTDQAIYL